MIVTFKSRASGDLIYFKDVALQLLKLMGRDEKVPSALFAGDVATALTQLQQGLAAIANTEREKAAQAEEAPGNGQSGAGKTYVSLNIRAMPLVEMLQKAVKKQCPVQWE
ncbi:DUF1840 domain-containing protein [Rheinheimera oceanensis]|uniref:DUF1840 domain-containing protein n=1 Tax=Rheinheimera oceanensis TaxID=2817449 RepID=UPI001BFCDEB8|nr:DUF1840 domain-containing protein [Rheinheimera oceanensis]